MKPIGIRASKQFCSGDRRTTKHTRITTNQNSCWRSDNFASEHYQVEVHNCIGSDMQIYRMVRRRDGITERLTWDVHAGIIIRGYIRQKFAPASACFASRIARKICKPSFFPFRFARNNDYASTVNFSIGYRDHE